MHNIKREKNLQNATLYYFGGKHRHRFKKILDHQQKHPTKFLLYLYRLTHTHISFLIFLSHKGLQISKTSNYFTRQDFPKDHYAGTTI